MIKKLISKIRPSNDLKKNDPYQHTTEGEIMQPAQDMTPKTTHIMIPYTKYFFSLEEWVEELIKIKDLSEDKINLLKQDISYYRIETLYDVRLPVVIFNLMGV